jgi:hypothetical protein
MKNSTGAPRAQSDLVVRRERYADRSYISYRGTAEELIAHGLAVETELPGIGHKRKVCATFRQPKPGVRQKSVTREQTGKYRVEMWLDPDSDTDFAAFMLTATTRQNDDQLRREACGEQRRRAAWADQVLLSLSDNDRISLALFVDTKRRAANHRAA